MIRTVKTKTEHQYRSLMKKKTKKQELVAGTYLLPLVYNLWENWAKIHLNKKGTKFPILNNGLHL